MHIRKHRVSLLALGLALAALAGCGIGPPAARTTPSRATLFRAAATSGSREEKDGWIIVHVAGNPSERGQQLGRLLAPEIRQVLQTVGQGDAAYWRDRRALVTRLFAAKITPEYAAEMQGIADGADATPALAHVDYTDILALNSVIDLLFSDAPDRLLPKGASQLGDGRHLPCSAFIATGPATSDGRIVLGHSTWFPGSAFAKHFNVLVDLEPDRGHRLLMEALPGTIASNSDWYLNDAGIVLTETTLAAAGHYQDGDPVFERSRKAVQYGSSIDEVIGTLAAHNNGDCPNEWLIGDMKTRDIAMFELATAHQAVWRSRQQQWYDGQVGFYGGFNCAKDPGVRAELGAWDDGRGGIWANFYAQHRGHIDAAVGRAGLELGGINDDSIDGKVADSASSASLASWDVWGKPGLGSQWELLGGSTFSR